MDRIVNNKRETLPYIVSVHLSKEDRKANNLKCTLNIKVSSSNDCFNQLLFQHKKYRLAGKLQFGEYNYHRESYFSHVTWDEANHLCEHQNSTLLTLADAEEEEHILSMLFGKFYDVSMKAYLIPVIYLGLKSMHQVFFGVLHN